jgi:hypothetical protein
MSNFTLNFAGTLFQTHVCGLSTILKHTVELFTHGQIVNCSHLGGPKVDIYNFYRYIYKSGSWWRPKQAQSQKTSGIWKTPQAPPCIPRLPCPATLPFSLSPPLALSTKITNVFLDNCTRSPCSRFHALVLPH